MQIINSHIEAMQGKKDYQEKLFIRFQLSDHIPADNIYRLLKGTLDLRFLYQDTAKYYGTEGQKSIDPGIALAFHTKPYPPAL
jgi:hypothetical protein